MTHIEICVEDQSGKLLLEAILPKILREDVSYRVHGYRGIGHVPKGLKTTDDAQKRLFLDNLPKLIRGCAVTPYISMLMLILDNDTRNCGQFLAELKSIHSAVAPAANVIFRLAIEEGEAWLLGDKDAVLAAYPKAKQSVLDSYVQDAICGTWEVLADAIEPAGSAGLIAEGWPAPGVAKCKWATAIGEKMEPARNVSPSFQKFLKALNPYM